MEDYYHFLALELDSTIDQFEDEQVYTHEICSLLAVSTGPIPETFYRLYTEHFMHRFADTAHLLNAIAYFSGAGLISINCDCEDVDRSLCEIYNIHTTNHFIFGVESARLNTPAFLQTHKKLFSLREALSQ